MLYWTGDAEICNQISLRALCTQYGLRLCHTDTKSRTSHSAITLWPTLPKAKSHTAFCKTALFKSINSYAGERGVNSCAFCASRGIFRTETSLCFLETWKHVWRSIDKRKKFGDVVQSLPARPPATLVARPAIPAPCASRPNNRLYMSKDASSIALLGMVLRTSVGQCTMLNVRIWSSEC